MARQICLAFRNTGCCRYGESCRFRHEPGEPIAGTDGFAVLPSWLVSDLPIEATASDVSRAFLAAMPREHAIAAQVHGIAASGYDTALHASGGNAARPYAHVTAASVGEEHGQDTAILASGIVICGTLCVVKRRRESKQERLADEGRRLAAKQAAAEKRAARRPLWQPEFLERFPHRRGGSGSTLDQHVQVSQLEQAHMELIELYLASRVPHQVAAALRRVWQTHLNSMRVKELFETIETFSLVESRIMRIPSLITVFDLACGHGLLGVLLAYRFPALRVVCVDLERCAR